MQYRKLANSDVQLSVLGFGCMRFPLTGDGDDPAIVDEEEARKMVRYSIDRGVNYIDTAYAYHGGESERIVSEILEDGYREKVYLATKLPTWKIEKEEDFNQYLEEQLENLKTDCIDFYLLHALNQNSWPKLKELGVIPFLEEALNKGKIEYAGFSFHDGLDTFKKIIDDFPWDFCQIQYNYMNENFQAGTQGLNYARGKDISVIVMEPLLGGQLGDKLPQEAQEIINRSGLKKTPAELALRWVCNNPNITCILSGMSTMEQVKENVEVVNHALPGSLAKEEKEVIEKVRDYLNTRIKANCTACGYCMPCPSGVNIRGILQFYNNAVAFGTEEQSRRFYGMMIELEKDASLCIECGECENACPQGIEIINHLKEAHKLLGKK